MLICITCCIWLCFFVFSCSRVIQKAGGKEPGSKNGATEAGQSSGSEGVAIATATLSQPPTTPTPSTPGTPKSPLPPTAATPTKVGAPEPVKSNPRSVADKQPRKNFL